VGRRDGVVVGRREEMVVVVVWKYKGQLVPLIILIDMTRKPDSRKYGRQSLTRGETLHRLCI